MPFDFGEDPVNEGDTVSVQCTISKGDNPLNITWTLRNKTIDQNQGFIISHLKRVGMLTIDSVQADNAGLYTCFASNPAGSTTYSTFLNINGTVLELYVICLLKHMPTNFLMIQSNIF